MNCPEKRPAFMGKTAIANKLRITLTLVYLLCIYTTLSIARPIAEFLRTTGILLPTVIFLFAGFTPIALFWRYKQISRMQFLVRIILLLTLVCLAVLISALPEERLHFLTYGLAGWLTCWSLEKDATATTSSQQHKMITSWLLPCLLVWLAGSIDEFI
ncbi:MAG: hypothetical protein D3909_16575, partial [Candidatus Electrothrix sp. ATG1]|nr:hypothetical protein [Candidatus Electrothrix sp. ATG1]